MNFLSRNFFIIDIIQVLAGVISIIAGIIAFYEYYFSEKSRIDSYILVVFIAVLIMSSLLIFKYWGMAISRYTLYAEVFHKFNHLLRNETVRLTNLKFNENLNNQALTNSLEKTCEAAVNLLEKLLSTITNNKICVHIKHFPDDIAEKSSLRTLCISTNSDNSRKTLNNHPIEGNTHISRIIKGVEDHFQTTNFKKYIKDYKKITGEEFKITSKNWERWFNSVIIVPIRIESKLKNHHDETEHEYLGFICCDGIDTNAFREYEMTAHVNMVKSFADGLYYYLDLISNLTEKINKK